MNGQLAKRKNLNEGKEEGLQQAWLENGRIYVNYEAKNGRIFGMNRTNLCYILKRQLLNKIKRHPVYISYMYGSCNLSEYLA